MKWLNKLVSVVLIFTLISTQFVLSANSLNDILLKNSTYAGTWEDPSSGMKYMTGGGIKLKFKATGNSFTPWVKGNVPGVKVGCNGISIDGGFIALLGLSDIEEQLQDAGAAFAWGILIGLAYSLPAISNVFQQIQKWARLLQNLLQNACQIGQNLTKNSGVSKKITETLQSDLIDEGFEKAKGFLDNIDEKFDALDKFINCGDDVACQKKKGGLVGEWIHKILGTMTNSFNAKFGIGITGGAAKKAKINNANEASYKEFELVDLLTTSSSISDMNTQEILNIKLALLFYGDIAVSKETTTFFKRHFENSGGLSKKELEETGKKLLAEGMKMQEIKFNLISASKSNADNIVDILINGAKKSLYVPNYKVGKLILPSKKGNTTESYVFLINEISSSNTTHDNLKLDWGGFFKEGRKQIVKMLNKNIDGTENEIFAIETSDSLINTPSENVPVLIPNLRDFVRKLKASVNTNKNVKYSVFEMVNKLAQVNAALATFALSNEISQRVKKAAYASDKQKDIFIAFIESIDKTRIAINDRIKQDYKDDKDVLMLLTKDIDDIDALAKRKTLQ